MFEGFSPETMDFLWGIRFNNNREWFAEHKAQYQRTLYEPMKALATELAAEFAGTERMKLHLSRIYRDMRMHPSTFYKDSLWFCLQHDGAPWLEQPSLCFELRPEGYRYGFLFFAARAADMERLRQKFGDHTDKFLRLLKNTERETGMTLEGDRYARPKPCTDTRLLPYFGMKNLMALRDCPPDELLFSRALAEQVKRDLRAWLPVYEFCLI